MAPVRRVLPVAAWLLALAALLVAMQAIGHGGLAGPELGRPGTWGGWAAGRTAPEAAIAVLRLVVVALAWYLLAVTAFAVALRLGRGGRLVTAADVVTLPYVRRLVQSGLGLGLAGAAVAAVGSGVATHPGPRGAPTAVEFLLVDAPSDGPAAMPRLPADDVAPVMQRLGDAPPAGERTWTVAAGDHLWSISERVLTAAWRRAPADHEVAPFWEQVVARNRDRLADPANPDLIFPGQVLVVPDPPLPD